MKFMELTQSGARRNKKGKGALDVISLIEYEEITLVKQLQFGENLGQYIGFSVGLVAVFEGWEDVGWEEIDNSNLNQILLGYGPVVEALSFGGKFWYGRVLL